MWNNPTNELLSNRCCDVDDAAKSFDDVFPVFLLRLRLRDIVGSIPQQ